MIQSNTIFDVKNCHIMDSEAKLKSEFNSILAIEDN